MTATPRLEYSRRMLAVLPLPPAPGEALRANWNPLDHPRGPDGKFGNGGGSASDYETARDDRPHQGGPLSAAALVADYKAQVGPTTVAERRAVVAYTGVQYQSINGWLRGNKFIPPSSPTDRRREDVEPQVAALNALASRYTTPTDRTVRRFSGRLHLPETPMSPGTVFRDDGMSSTTTGEGRPRGFEHSPVEMHIELPAGSHGVDVNAIGGGVEHEHEFILPPGTAFEVISDDDYPETDDEFGVRFIVVRAITPKLRGERS